MFVLWESVFLETYSTSNCIWAENIIKMIWLRLLTYMWRIVQEEWALILDSNINELRCKFAVGLLKLEEICRLLLDNLIKHERYSYHTLITVAIALHIWRKAGEILTGTLWYRDKGIFLKYYAMMRDQQNYNIKKLDDSLVLYTVYI